MKLKTSDLQGAALDWAVAKCEGRDQFFSLNLPKHKEHCFSRMVYSTDWAQGGPIIERERMQLWVGQNWNASMDSNNINSDKFESGPTPLIAAMRCYVASKLGDSVEVPDEILEGSQA